VADLTKKISEDYGVLFGDAGVAFRGTFLIDKEGVVRHSVINDLGLGRSIDEALRMVEALRYHEAHGEVCPANWKDGDEAMKPTSDGVADYLSKHGK
jgi:peroxiredoxin (alkyl hydroperoxide reductase subunit C)